MATWQADFHFVIDASDLPADYRERFSAVLPLGQSWSNEIEQWGSEDSDRIDVFKKAGRSLKSSADLTSVSGSLTSTSDLSSACEALVVVSARRRGKRWSFSPRRSSVLFGRRRRLDSSRTREPISRLPRQDPKL